MCKRRVRTQKRWEGGRENREIEGDGDKSCWAGREGAAFCAIEDFPWRRYFH